MRRGQPAVHGKHARLGAKTHKHQHKRKKQHPGRAPPGGQKSQAAPRKKGAACTISIEVKDTEQRHKCTGHGIEQIFQPRHHRLMAQTVEHHGQGGQSHHLEEKIQRDQIARMVQRHQYPHDDQVKAEIPVLLLLMLHIFKSKHASQCPRRHGHACKEPGQAVHAHTDLQCIRQFPEHQFVIIKEHQSHHQCGGKCHHKKDQQTFDPALLPSVLVKKQDQPRQDREQDRRPQ